MTNRVVVVTRAGDHFEADNRRYPFGDVRRVAAAAFPRARGFMFRVDLANAPLVAFRAMSAGLAVAAAEPRALATLDKSVGEGSEQSVVLLAARLAPVELLGADATERPVLVTHAGDHFEATGRRRRFGSVDRICAAFPKAAFEFFVDAPAAPGVAFRAVGAGLAVATEQPRALATSDQSVGAGPGQVAVFLAAGQQSVERLKAEVAK